MYILASQMYPLKFKGTVEDNQDWLCQGKQTFPTGSVWGWLLLQPEWNQTAGEAVPARICMPQGAVSLRSADPESGFSAVRFNLGCRRRHPGQNLCASRSDLPVLHRSEACRSKSWLLLHPGLNYAAGETVPTRICMPWGVTSPQHADLRHTELGSDSFCSMV